MAKDWIDHLYYYVTLQEAFFDLDLEKVERCESPIEKVACLYLHMLYRSHGKRRIAIEPQKQIGKYRVDIAIYYWDSKQTEATHKIIIECDGHEFHEKTKEQAARDKKRDRFLSKKGYTVLRYTGSEIMHEPLQIVEDVEEIMIPGYKGVVGDG